MVIVGENCLGKKNSVKKNRTTELRIRVSMVRTIICFRDKEGFTQRVSRLCQANETLRIYHLNHPYKKRKINGLFPSRDLPSHGGGENYGNHLSPPAPHRTYPSPESPGLAWKEQVACCCSPWVRSHCELGASAGPMVWGPCWAAGPQAAWELAPGLFETTI